MESLLQQHSRQTFNSLYEIQDTLKAARLKALTLLSILYMRFQRLIEEEEEAVKTFNSLYEIHICLMITRTHINRPFNSLYEIRCSGCWSYLSAGRLSILYMRFKVVDYERDRKLSAFNSLYEIQIFCTLLGLQRIRSFNSLYEIQRWLISTVKHEVRLSILYMRFVNVSLA